MKTPSQDFKRAKLPPIRNPKVAVAGEPTVNTFAEKHYVNDWCPGIRICDTSNQYSGCACDCPACKAAHDEVNEWRSQMVASTGNQTVTGVTVFIRSLKQEQHLDEQVASNNSDWFDQLVHDLAGLLKCEEKPPVILDKIAELRVELEKAKDERNKAAMRERSKYIGVIRDLSVANLEACKEGVALIQLLAKYVAHVSDCSHHDIQDYRACTCGLDAVMRRAAVYTNEPEKSSDFLTTTTAQES